MDMVLSGKMVPAPEKVLTGKESHTKKDAQTRKEVLTSGEVLTKDFATVIEWKVIQIDYLDIQLSGTEDERHSKALTLSKISDPEGVLGIKFNRKDKWRGGRTIEDWISGKITIKGQVS